MSPEFLEFRFRRCVAVTACLLAALLPVAHAQQSPEAAQQFDVFEYQIEGNTVLNDSAIEAAVYAHMGPGRTADDVESARAALEKAYQDAGYLTVVVELPEQRVDHGVVVLQVVQGEVERLKVTGARYHLPSRVREETPSLAAGSVPHFPQVQAELDQLARSSDRQVTPLLRQGRAPGKVEVELQVTDTLPFAASFEVNNKQSFNTEQGRTEAAIAYRNLFQRGHSIGLNWIYSPRAPDQLNVLAASYGIPLKSGDLTMSAVVSDSDIPAELGGATVVQGTAIGLRYRHTLPARHYGIYHGLSLGFDYKDNKDALDRSGLIIVPRSLRYTTLASRYDLTVPHGESGALSTFEANLNVGVEPFTDRDVDCDGLFRTNQFDCKRQGASPNFAVWRFAVAHRRPVLDKWTLSGRAEIQFASGPLVPQEQIGAGGVDTVRGYYEYERFGDHGALLRMELSTPPLVNLETYRLTGLGFYDRAHLRVADPLAGEESRLDLGSYGLGLRLDGGKVSARLDIAIPTHTTSNRSVDAQNNPITIIRTRRNDLTVHLGVGYQF